MQKIENDSCWMFSRSFRHNLTSWYASFRRAWYYLATMRVFQERCKLGSEIRRRSRLNSILIVETPLCSEYPRFGSHILAGVSYTSHKLGARFDRELLFNLALVAGTTFPQMIYRFRFSFFQRLNNLLSFHSYFQIRFVIFFFKLTRCEPTYLTNWRLENRLNFDDRVFSHCSKMTRRWPALFLPNVNAF